MKLMIIGHATHGKDTACELLCEMFGLSFQSSSYVLAERVARPWLAERGIVYDSLEACYADRVNHRAEWYNALKAYNTPDGTRLGREIYSRYDIYGGIRNPVEFLALLEAGEIDVTLWIDASKRLPPEPTTSNKMLPSHADFIVDNNGTLEDFRANLRIVYAKAKRGFYK